MGEGLRVVVLVRRLGEYKPRRLEKTLPDWRSYDRFLYALVEGRGWLKTYRAGSLFEGVTKAEFGVSVYPLSSQEDR